ncbi:pre-rRNA-processing protein esf1 [Beauveria asiatica]|uniref:Pre-rRNA-processing protein esf1 n=1 Tax=Beauveria asiatica TaxID=1069075 RepID=A0AAW0RTN8_9HYPO
MKSDKKKGAPAPSRIADARFSNFETDPRFRLPSKKNAKIKLDKRFAGMLDDEDFTSTSHVDRYGRKVKSDSKKKALLRLYEAEGDKEEEEEEMGSEAEIEVDDDDAVQRELRAVHERDLRANYDPARGGGFSSSEEDSSEEEDSEDDDEGGAELITEGDMQRLQDEQAEVEAGEVSKRIAIVNLDWDHVNSTNLFALFSSFIGESSGRVVKVSVYPSEFGKERMQREEIEGPPKELFKENKDDSDSDEEEDSDEEDEKIKKKLIQEGDDQEFDSDALRKYQLDRLRYYYAIMECSDEKIAQQLYEATDGTEYQSSSNFLDLRFVPDDVEFDDEPRDECTELPDSYKPVEFVTTALQSSKVKLTWDLHPEEATRKDSIKRAFTGSRADLEENDLRAYLASDTEGSDNDDDDGHKVATFGAEDDNNDDSDNDDGDNPAGQAGEEKPKLSKQERARQKMRAALGLGEKPAPKAAKGGPVGEMQITFTPALSDAKATKSAEDVEETTIEKYKRKERERKERKREAARARRAGANGETAAAGSDDEEGGATMAFNNNDDNGEDLGFNDPFFTSEAPAAASKSSIRKAERLQKREARLAANAANAEERAHLSKVMAEDDAEGGATAAHLDHFDMKEILRAEKQQRKKAKAKGKAKKAAAAEEDKDGASAGAQLQRDFKMDVNDARFQAVFDNHEYAIDPSHPKFTASAGMKQVLEESRRKRRAADSSEGREETRKSKKTKSRR